MKTIYKEYTVNYQFSGSVWTNEHIKIIAMTLEQAKVKAYKCIYGVYGGEICKDLTIL